jgi:hypothetical protein
MQFILKRKGEKKKKKKGGKGVTPFTSFSGMRTI